LRGRRGGAACCPDFRRRIPDNADYRVIVEPLKLSLGPVNEDFAVESMAGDIFQSGMRRGRFCGSIPALSGSKMRRVNRPEFHFGWVSSRAHSRIIRSVSTLREEMESCSKPAADVHAWLAREIGLPAQERETDCRLFR